MNLLQILWSWLTSLFAKAPELVEEECCEPAPEPIMETHAKEEPTPVVVEVVEEVAAAPAPVGELLKQILLAEGINEGVIGKYQIIETFEGWYDGPIDDASVRASIQDFKSAQGGVIKAKLSRIQ